MERTGLGLTKIDPGETPWTDGGSFFGRNQDVIDHLARLGALTHRHDAHAPLANPATAPTATTAATGGQLPNDTPVSVAFTAIDDQGGETLASPAALMNTPAPGGQPGIFTGTPDYASGSLKAGTYYYALTVTDAAGGETPASDPVAVIIAPGHTYGRVQLSGLTAAVAAAAMAGAVGWRLYRSSNGGDYGFLAAGSGDVYTDDCSNCADTTLPPPDDLSNSTSGTAVVTVTVPAAALPAGTVSYRLYAGIDPTFPNPSLVGEFAATDAGTAHAITTLTLEVGQPPAVSTAVGGAAKVLATRDIDWTGYVGGGGGGGVSNLKLVPPLSVSAIPMARGSRLSEYALTFDDTWALIAVLAQGVWGTGLDIAGGTDYNPAQFGGDPASFAMTAPGGNLTTVAASGEQFILTNAGLVALGTDGLAEFDYAPVGNGWENVLVGVGGSNYPTSEDAVAVMVDRAAGTLSLVSITSLNPLTFTTLASVGAADGYTPPNAGDTGSLYLQQWGDRVWGVDTRLPTLMLEAVIPAANPTATASANRGLIGGSWTTAGDLQATYASFYPLTHQRRIDFAPVQSVDRPTDGGVQLEVNIAMFPAVTLVSEGDILTPVTFENGWAGNLSWRKPAQGPLEIAGSVNTGAVGTPIFTLPTGHRPPWPLRVPIVTDAGPSYVDIGTDGTVTPPAAAGNTRLDFAVSAIF